MGCVSSKTSRENTTHHKVHHTEWICKNKLELEFTKQRKGSCKSTQTCTTLFSFHDDSSEIISMDSVFLTLDARTIVGINDFKSVVISSSVDSNPEIDSESLEDERAVHELGLFTRCHSSRSVAHMKWSKGVLPDLRIQWHSLELPGKRDRIAQR